MRKSKLLKITKRTGIFYNVLLMLTCAVVGLNTTHRGFGLGLMACAGFFGGILFITMVVLWFRVKPQDYKSH